MSCLEGLHCDAEKSQVTCYQTVHRQPMASFSAFAQLSNKRLSLSLSLASLFLYSHCTQGFDRHRGVFTRLNQLTRRQERALLQHVVALTSPESSLYIATMSFTDIHSDLLDGISQVTFTLKLCHFKYRHQEGSFRHRASKQHEPGCYRLAQILRRIPAQGQSGGMGKKSWWGKRQSLSRHDTDHDVDTRVLHFCAGGPVLQCELDVLLLPVPGGVVGVACRLRDQGACWAPLAGCRTDGGLNGPVITNLTRPERLPSK